MSQQPITFKRIAVTRDGGGLIKHFNLEVTDPSGKESRRVSVTPRQLSSAVSMKRLLLSIGISYSATRQQHEQMLLGLTSRGRSTDSENA